MMLGIAVQGTSNLVIEDSINDRCALLGRKARWVYAIAGLFDSIRSIKCDSVPNRFRFT